MQKIKGVHEAKNGMNKIVLAQIMAKMQNNMGSTTVVLQTPIGLFDTKKYPAATHRQ